MTERVVVTGLGCLSSVGENFITTWNSIIEKKTGIDKVTLWDSSKWEYSLGGEIKNYIPQNLIPDRKLLKLISRQDVLGLNAVHQAVKHSQLLDYKATLSDHKMFNEHSGVFVSSPGNKFNQQYDFLPLLSHCKGDLQVFGQKLPETVHPMWLLRVLPNNVLAYAGIQYEFKGPNQNIVNHSVGGLQAIIEASEMLREGWIDRAIVVGYDTALEPQSQLYYASTGLLSKNGLYPFHEKHDGTVLAEGAGCMVLETFSAAKERNAKIYGEILGHANTSDALGTFAIEKDGQRLSECMQEAVQKSFLNPENISLVTTHGNGVINSDVSEASAINRVFKHKPIITGFKWSLGHTLAAAGVIETIMTLLSLQNNKVPGIANLTKLSIDCEGLNAGQNAVPIAKDAAALIVNRGFGSLNSCLVVKGVHE